MERVKPCPFCGAKVSLQSKTYECYAGNYFENSYSTIECVNCGIAMSEYPKRGYGTTKEQDAYLIKRWNRRSGD